MNEKLTTKLRGKILFDIGEDYIFYTKDYGFVLVWEELKDYLCSITEDELCEKCGETPCGNYPICCDCDPDFPCPTCLQQEDEE